jgi:phosphoribosylamine---glycine ligase
LQRRLHQVHIDWDERCALGVVIAAAGYPDTVRTGDVIEGLEQAARVPGKLFHAATRRVDGRVLTSGGRVLCAVGLGADVAGARAEAYRLAASVHFAGAQYRSDIGHRALARANGSAQNARPITPR